MLSYLDLSQILQHAGAEAGTAECHGFLCGQVCVTAFPDEDLWMEFLDVQTANMDLEYECYDEIRNLMREIEQQLLSLDCIFEVLLPAEETDLIDRVNALGDWCHGFLNGFGLVEDGLRPLLSEDGTELLKDLGMICRVGLEEADEEDERALAEIVEYIRTGVMMLFDETRSDISRVEQREVMH